jgi:hypothetical protein
MADLEHSSSSLLPHHHHHHCSNNSLRLGMSGQSNSYATYTPLRGADPESMPLLARPPGSPTHVSYQKMFNLNAFRSVPLWKQAFLEGVGMFLFFLPSSGKAHRTRKY